MSNPASSRSFYVDLDAGNFDNELDELYALLVSDGEIFQASEVVERALSQNRSDVWLKRRAQRSEELKTLDTRWLPDRLLPEIPEIESEAGVVLGMFKSSLPQALAGYTIRTQYTLEAQLAAGFRVVPCTPIGFGDHHSRTEMVRSVEYRRLTSQADHRDLGRAQALEVNARALFDVGIMAKPELVHASSGFYGPDMGLVGLAVARALHRPFVYEIRGALPETWAYNGSELKVHRQISWLRWSQELRVSGEANAVVVIGDDLKLELERGGIDQKKIFVIPNGVDPELFKALRPGSVRQIEIPGFNPDRPTLGYISNLGAREGHLVLVGAVDELRAKGIGVNCLIVGDGPMRNRIEDEVVKRGLSDRVFVVGSVPHEQIVQYYSALDLFVVPREDDRAARYTTPLKPFEAMAMKVPLVVSDLPALEEVIGYGERGRSFYCGSASSLASVVTEVLEDLAQTRRRTDAAFEWVTGARKWSDNASRYRAAFEYALSGH